MQGRADMGERAMAGGGTSSTWGRGWEGALSGLKSPRPLGAKARKAQEESCRIRVGVLHCQG